LGILRQKCHLSAGPMAMQRVYYKGEGGGFPQVQVVVNLVSPRSPVSLFGNKNAPAMH
jgi:hypothetical protein